MTETEKADELAMLYRALHKALVRAEETRATIKACLYLYNDDGQCETVVDMSKDHPLMRPIKAMVLEMQDQEAAVIRNKIAHTQQL